MWVSVFSQKWQIEIVMFLLHILSCFYLSKMPEFPEFWWNHRKRLFVYLCSCVLNLFNWAKFLDTPCLYVCVHKKSSLNTVDHIGKANFGFAVLFHKMDFHLLPQILQEYWTVHKNRLSTSALYYLHQFSKRLWVTVNVQGIFLIVVKYIKYNI